VNGLSHSSIEQGARGGLGMAKAKSWEVTDEFWKRVKPLVPVRERPPGNDYVRKAGGGRKPKDARLVFEGTVYVLGQVASGGRCPSTLAVPVPSTRAFYNGRRREAVELRNDQCKKARR
jgi:transposase